MRGLISRMYEMQLEKYYTITGLLLLVMAFSPGFLKKLPITSSVIYLAFGVMLGPHGFQILNLEYFHDSKLIEVIAEITVIISLFTVGLKLRFPLRDRRWMVPLSLATLSMVLTILIVTCLGHFFISLPWGEAILLGAILAPTDPVLASEVQLDGPHDKDNLKFSLSCEGGLNDGTAFPFVMMGLGLAAISDEKWSLMHWLTVDLVWAIVCGLVTGIITGLVISKLAGHVKHQRKSFYLEDFLTIAAIALSYGLAIQLKGYGFLAVFACALTIRQLELKESTLLQKLFKNELPDDALSFNEQLERIFEVVSVVTIGILINLNTFEWRYLALAIVLLFIARPVAVFLGLLKSRSSLKQKSIISWFGIRGIGSLYYLYYSLNHGLRYNEATEVINLTLWCIFFSILVHGISVKPIMKRV